ELLPQPPSGLTTGVRDAAALARAPELRHVRHVETAGLSAWRSAGRAQSLLGRGGAVVLAGASVGNGRVLLLADPSPLQNRLLGRRDNAELGLALAGPPGRPVAFLESYHGYGS